MTSRYAGREATEAKAGLREGGEAAPMRRGPERALSRGEAIRGDKVMIAPVKVQRLHANESGLSRFDTFEIEREMTLFAPPAQPFPVSASTPASRFVLLQLPAGWSGASPPNPLLSGRKRSCHSGCRRCRNRQRRGHLAHGGHDRRRPHDGGHLAGTLRSGSDPVAG